MPHSLRNKGRVDYAKVENKYKGVRFGGVKKPKVRHLARTHQGAPGRAYAAPPLTAWPVNGQHADVAYVDDIATDQGWANAAADKVRLPFRHLDVTEPATWQGLIQTVTGLNGQAKAQDHFDEITDTMGSSTKQTVITECVGEAAAAICMLTDNAFTGYEMIWGFDTHSGTGIDQIWRQANNAGGYTYMIVEAKGPGAGLNPGLWVPPNFAQMDEGWVMNHLYSMNNNNRPAGVEVVQALKLDFTCAHPNYGGASKSYYTVGPQSMHKTATSTLYGMVVTARWLADGRLWYAVSNQVRYLN